MSISSKELARNKIEKLVNKWNNSTGSDFTEQDTVTNFILPFLEALGWDIYNVYELKQGGYPVSLRKTVPVESRSLKKPDCVISLNDNPHMVFEFKPLVDGGDIDRYKHRKDKLQEEVQYLNAKYGILTNFSETMVYDANGKELTKFKCPKEYIDRFNELWEYLSKERTSYQKG
jgi:hypothetical protein